MAKLKYVGEWRPLHRAEGSESWPIYIIGDRKIVINLDRYAGAGEYCDCLEVADDLQTVITRGIVVEEEYDFIDTGEPFWEPDLVGFAITYYPQN